MMMERLLERLLYVFLAVIMIVTILLFVVWMPVALYTEAECLRAGYPKSNVTIGLERYCVTLDGAVTVKVTKP